MNHIRRKLFHSRRKGNMLAMIATAGAVILIIIVIGITIMMLMMSQKRAQGKVEELSLSWASELNKDDLVGEMNNMTGFSRELVYTSRQAFDTIANQHGRMKPLALQLLEESRQAAILVDSERKVLIRSQLKSLQKIVDSVSSDSSKIDTGVSLPFLSAKKPILQNVDTGYIDSVTSNIAVPDAIPGLKDYDLQQKFFIEKSGFYKGNINALLPSPDNDLDFKFASISAPVRGSLSPARLTSNSVFRKLMTVGPEAGNDFSKCPQLPSAVQVSATMEISSKRGESVSVEVSAASPGATLKLP